MHLQEWIFNAKTQRDEPVNIALDYNPKAYTTKEQAARGLHAALVKLATETYGQAASEVILQTPQQSDESGHGDNWRVCWEAGPFEWAIGASFQITGPWGWTEPYYSFDLCFVE